MTKAIIYSDSPWSSLQTYQRWASHRFFTQVKSKSLFGKPQVKSSQVMPWNFQVTVKSSYFLKGFKSSRSQVTCDLIWLDLTWFKSKRNLSCTSPLEIEVKIHRTFIHFWTWLDWFKKKMNFSCASALEIAIKAHKTPIHFWTLLCIKVKSSRVIFELNQVEFQSSHALKCSSRKSSRVIL